MYFEKRRAFATGLAVCGAGIGTFIFSPLTNYLLEEYSWRGTFLIYAGVLLNCCVCGALFRPLTDATPIGFEMDIDTELMQDEPLTVGHVDSVSYNSEPSSPVPVYT